jgi:undecaprenyl-diphosphatase
MFDSPLAQAILLGVIQGLTEFLPISSSAHLLVTPWLLGWKPMGLAFDVALHLGTLASVILYFKTDLADLLTELKQACFSRRSAESSDRLWLAILAGTVPAAVLGGLFGDAIEEHLRSPLVTVGTLTVFGALLWWADRVGEQSREIDVVGWKEGLIVGLAQTLALAPGVSRSGVTITAALLLGLTRPHAARFSFLLATPIIAMAAAKATYDLWRAGPLDPNSAIPVAVGIMVSAVTGFLCIKYFLRFLQRSSCLPFVIYRWALACFIFLWWWR